MSTVSRTDVVIVGAGPVGLVAACELVGRGIDVRIIDELPVPTDQSRAIVVHARSLEMLARMGLARQVVDAGNKAVAMQMLAGTQHVARVDLSQVDSEYPFSITIAQTSTEQILGQRLRELGGSVERGVTLVGLEQNDEGVTLTCKHVDDTSETIEASWVIGSDGSHSTVRQLVGSRLDGSFEGVRFVLGDVEADSDLDTDTMYTYFSPDGPLLAFPMGGKRIRIMAQHHDADGQPHDAPPTQQELQDLIHTRGADITITESHWLTKFEIHHAQVSTYRYGRAFLAGDSAHVHSPAGGQGMNAGMQDAFNLAWKLARTVHGEGGELLLNSYNAERHPVAARVIKLSTRLTDLGTVQGDLANALRNHAFQAAAALASVRHAIASDLEETDLAYRNSPIVLGGHHGHLRIHAGDALPPVDDAHVQRQLGDALHEAPDHTLVTVAASGTRPAAAHDAYKQILVSEQASGLTRYATTIADPTRATARRFGIRRDTRILIRPDGYIGCIADFGDDNAIARYLATIES